MAFTMYAGAWSKRRKFDLGRALRALATERANKRDHRKMLALEDHLLKDIDVRRADVERSIGSSTSALAASELQRLAIERRRSGM